MLYQRLLAVILPVLLLCACTSSWLASHDSRSEQMMQELAAQVDGFYLRMQYQKERPFSRFQQQYLDIEVQLSALKLAQQMRANNELTLKQVEAALTLWQKDLQAHKKADSLSDFIVQRRRAGWQRLFLALLTGEQAKVVATP